MLTFTAKLTVKAGGEAEFERTMRAAVPKVREEPGNHAYVLHRLKDNPQVKLKDTVVRQSSDNEFHCLTIVVFYDEE